MAVFVTACGGGGGGNGAAATPPPPPPDTTPNPFLFNDLTGAPRDFTIDSDGITISGINAEAAIEVAGGEYSVDGGAFTSLPGTVSSGQTVVVRVTTPSSPGD
jgi:hypothetical protein